MSHRPRNRQQGFTLLELLIAISVFAVLSAAAYSALNAITDKDQTVQTSMNRLASLQKTLLVLQADIEQLRDRPIRNLYGDREPAFHSVIGDPNLFASWTRGGKQTWVGGKTSSLLRVGYGLKDNKLMRYYWPVLDQAPDSQPLENSLLNNVESFEMRFLDSKQQWHSSWPPLDSASATPSSELPVAIEVSLELEDWGNIKRLFHGIY